MEGPIHTSTWHDLVARTGSEIGVSRSLALIGALNLLNGFVLVVMGGIPSRAREEARANGRQIREEAR